MDKQERERQSQLVEMAVDSIAAMERGTVIAHEVLQRIFEADQDSQTYYKYISRVKRKLMADGVFLGCKVGQGYVVMPDKAAHLIPDARVRRAARQIGRATHEYECIPLARLEQTERDKVVENMQRAGTLYGLIRKSLAPKA